MIAYNEYNSAAANVFSRSSTYNDAKQLTTQSEVNNGKSTTTFDCYDTPGTNNNAGALYTTRLVAV